MLNDLGISKVINKYSSISNIDSFFEDLTMTIMAELNNTGNEKRYTDAVRTYFYSGFHNFNGYYYTPDYECKEIKAKIKTEAGGTTEFIAGFYIPSRNLINIIVPLFYYDWNGISDKPMDLIEGIVESLKELKVAKVDISKEIEKSRIKSFMKVIKDKIKDLKSAIENNQNEIDANNKSVIDLTKKITCNSKMIESLIDLEKQDASIITGQIEKIKKIPFVKEVVLTNDGIAVYIGEIKLKYNKFEYNLGRFRIYIKPKEISIYNLDAIKRGGGIYDHPHVDNSRPCMNTWSIKLNEMLTKMDFVNLVIFLKMYLQSYSNNEEGKPYVNIEDWNILREKQLLHLSDPVPEIGKERDYLNNIRDKELENGK